MENSCSSCFYCVVQLQSKPVSNYESNTNKLRHVSRVCVLWKQIRRPLSDLSLQSVIVLTRDYPDSKVHGAHLGPVGPRWAPWWPHKPCYQGKAGNLLVQPAISCGNLPCTPLIEQIPLDVMLVLLDINDPVVLSSFVDSIAGGSLTLCNLLCGAKGTYNS